MHDHSFLWGAATSSHQIEGNNIHNDWWAWEKHPGHRRSGAAADSWQRWREDVALTKTLGHNAHRLSLEWSRLEPAPNSWDTRATLHYQELLQAYRAAGMTTFVTLHHFTNPLWLSRLGGWEKAVALQHWLRYVRYCVTHFGDLVDFWVTVNEPTVYAGNGWLKKRWPPQKQSRWLVWQVLRHLAQAHSLAYSEIHRHLPLARVGAANHLIAFGDDRRRAFWFNHYFLRATRGTHDFLGVNYYFPAVQNWQGPNSDLGWPIYAAGLTEVLLEMKRYRVPIYITENGVADATDKLRPDFIRDHLRAVEEAQAQGADVRGYLHWSLLDNFEWDLGFEPRFGLVEVDYTTQKRTPRPSAYVYKAIIEQATR